jgi:hypothetical protein
MLRYSELRLTQHCCQHGQKRLDTRRADVARMPHRPTARRPANEKTNPIQVNLLGAEAIVQVPDALAHLIQQSGGLQRWGASFYRKFITGYLSGIDTVNLGCKPLSGVFYVQCRAQRPVYKAGFALDITLGLTRRLHAYSTRIQYRNTLPVRRSR